MSLNVKILSLLSGIIGVSDRVGIASTIFYICDLYLDGNIKEEKARAEIYNICYNIVRFANFDLTEDEARKKARVMADEIMRAVKLEGTRRLVLSKFKSRGSSILPF